MTATGYWILTWLGGMLISGFWVYYQRKKALNLNEVISVAISVFTIGLTVRLGYKLVTSPQLQQLLGPDVSALVIGMIATVWVSIEQIRDLVNKE